jgi:hypothetical protein
MTAKATAAEMTRLTITLIEHGIAIDSNASVVLGEGAAKFVTWQGSGNAGSLIAGRGDPTLEDYREWLVGRQYNCLLRDGAMIQVSVSFESQQLVHYRMCYWPCPVALDDDALTQSDSAVDVIEWAVARALERWIAKPVDDDVSDESNPEMGTIVANAGAGDLRMTTPIRFDFDISTASHPVSHLTIGRACCRIPVYGPISLGHFVRFVFTQAYPEIESEVLAGLSSWPRRHGTRSIRPSEEREMHINCLCNSDVGQLGDVSGGVDGRSAIG